MSAVGDYFGGLLILSVPAKNREADTGAARHPPLPDILFESETDKLLAAANGDPHLLLILLLLETGMKKAEL